MLNIDVLKCYAIGNSITGILQCYGSRLTDWRLDLVDSVFEMADWHHELTDCYLSMSGHAL